MEIKLSSTEKTKELARKLATQILPGDVIALWGDLGAGKTTFTRYLVDALGFTARVQSPTFIIMRRYNGFSSGIKHINHIDLYRVSSKDELEDLGLQEIFEQKDTVTIIEWPDIIEDILPANHKSIKFEEIDDDARKATLQGFN